MDDATLKRFETFHIGSSQNLSEHEASYYAESEPGNISKPGHSTTLPLETSNECTLSPPTNSHQCPPGQPLRQTRTARKNKRAVKAQEVPSRGSYDQPGQDPLFPQQASNPSQFLSGPGLKSPGGTGTRAQRRQYNSKASCFVPQSPCTKAAHSETELLAHRQKVCLSTKAATPNLTLPFRSRRLAGLPPESFESLSSSGAKSQVRGRGKGEGYEGPKIVHKLKNSDELLHIPSPEPTEPYLAKADTPAICLSTPKSLLLVLDLNGTLLFRTTMATHYVPRPGLGEFLDYCFANHSVLIWSSARPRNVVGMCKKVFTPVQQSLLLGQWGRDTLGLSPEQYQQRVQVYKNLDTVWSNPEIQSRHPSSATGGRWGQEDTVIIDDSALKAAAQPFNLVQVPEFVRSDDSVQVARGVLEQVKSKLEELRAWDNVSAMIRAQQAGDGAR